MITRWIINALVLLGLPYLLEGIDVDGFGAALVAAAVLGIVNAVIRPIAVALTLPLNVITFGLFSFVINAAMLLLAARVVKGFSVDGFGTALLGSLILAVASSILSSVVD